MKTLSIVAAAFVAASSGAAMGAPKEVTLTVPTMDCATCPVTIKAALLKELSEFIEA